MFLNQAQAIAYDGFIEGQVGPDPEYPTCFQCAAIDRARLKTNPVTPRSDICTSCFKKYCYDPANPPSGSQIVGRRFQFKDPDPFFKSFYEHNKSTVIVGGVVVALVLLASFTGCAIFWRRRHQRTKARAGVIAAYKQVARGEGEGAEWSAYYDTGRPSEEVRYSAPGYDHANAQAEPSFETATLYSPQPGYPPGGKAHYRGLSDATAYDYEAAPRSGAQTPTSTLHVAEPGYATGKHHYQEASDATVYDPEPTPKAHFAELRYDPPHDPPPPSNN